MENMFKNAKQILKAVKKAEEVEARQISRKCDWKDQNDKAFHYSLSRVERRRRLIAHKTGGICPKCKERVINSRSWVVRKDKTVVCRTCHFGGIRVMKKEMVVIDGFRIASLRDAAGIKLYAFATKAGWSIAYQWKLENKTKRVSKETYEVIAETFQRFGIIFS